LPKRECFASKHSGLAVLFKIFVFQNALFFSFVSRRKRQGIFILRSFRKQFTAIFLLSILAFAACRNETPQVAQKEATREITDDLGRNVRVPEKVERAVSLAPNLTENIFAVGAGSKLVGVTTFCNYPEEAKKIQKIGDTMNPNMETIIALKPQIVFVSTASQIENFTKQLESQNIAVFVTNPKNLDDVLKNLRELGDIFGTERQTTELLNNLQLRIIELDEQVKNKPKVKTFVQISKEPLFTIGKDSFLTEIIERAGGISVTKTVETAYPKLSKETALALNPDAIILSDSEDNKEPNEVFKNSNAVKNGKVFKINADLLSRPGPRIIDALELIAKDL
jgi:iron complex transport system substrate-binding protein